MREMGEMKEMKEMKKIKLYHIFKWVRLLLVFNAVKEKKI